MKVFSKKVWISSESTLWPTKKHKTCIKKSLRAVTVEQGRIITSKWYRVKPGQKLCSSCRSSLLKTKDNEESSDEDFLVQADKNESGSVEQVM